MNETNRLSNLTEEIREFAAERDWDQFHSLKNLSMAMTIEAAEIMEIFQWLTLEESNNLPAEKKQDLSEELGDVFVYLLPSGTQPRAIEHPFHGVPSIGENM